RRIDSLWRFASSDHLSCTRRTCPRVPERARLRHAAGCEEHRPRRVKASHHRQLRSRGGGGDERDHHRANFCGIACAVIPPDPSILPASAGSARHDERAKKTTEILKKIRTLEIKTRGLVETAFAGDYHSVFKGRGMNFEDVREYQPGDEIRAIDWNV